MSEVKTWTPNSSGLKAKPLGSDKPQANPLLMKILISVGVFILVVGGIVGFVFYTFIFAPGQVLKSKVDVLKKDANAIQQSLVKRDLVTAETHMQKVEKDLKDIRSYRDEKFKWLNNFPQTKGYYADSEYFINTGVYAVDALREAITVVKPFADAAGLKVENPEATAADEGLMEAFSKWISIMPEVANNIDGVIVKLDKVGDEIKKVDPNRYPDEFNGMEVRPMIVRTQSTLSNVSEYAPDIKKALMVIPAILGVETPEKRYMVIMQNDKELRATGGFWTNYATFKIKNGMLSSDFSSKDMYSVDLTLDAIDATFDFPDAPAAYQKYLLVERWYARDANYSPDLPTSIDKFMYSYNMAMRIDPLEIKPVDGIVTIDTQVVSELLDVTGPVTVNGFTYTKDNVVLELEKVASLALREQANRKRVLGDLMEGMLINVFESDKNLWPKLIDKGIDLAIRKHIQGFSYNPDAQALLEKYNVGGRVVDPVNGDYSYVVSTNLGGDKTNWFTTKEVAHTLSNEDGKWVDTVKIKYNYKEPLADYGPFVKRFKDWVRVYAPNGSTLISVDGSMGETGTDTERNKAIFYGYVELGPNETKEITFKYSLPNGVISGDTYNLYLQKQGGIGTETHTVTVNGKTQTIQLKTDQKLSIKLK